MKHLAMPLLLLLRCAYIVVGKICGGALYVQTVVTGAPLASIPPATTAINRSSELGTERGCCTAISQINADIR